MDGFKIKVFLDRKSLPAHEGNGGDVATTTISVYKDVGSYKGLDGLSFKDVLLDNLKQCIVEGCEGRMREDSKSSISSFVEPLSMLSRRRERPC
ncbi:hypothetical protein V6N13_074708 [Hibiscus sabdariffa]